MAWQSIFHFYNGRLSMSSLDDKSLGYHLPPSSVHFLVILDRRSLFKLGKDMPKQGQPLTSKILTLSKT